jgi:hypothetical protein
MNNIFGEFINFTIMQENQFGLELRFSLFVLKQINYNVLLNFLLYKLFKLQPYFCYILSRFIMSYHSNNTFSTHKKIASLSRCTAA